MSDTPRCIYEFGPFRVDALRRVLLREGDQVRLPAKAFEILLVLLEEKGRVVEKEELMRRVWPDAVVEENNLTVNVSALRKSLGEVPQEHRYLVTVPGRGYQFVAGVRQEAGGSAWETEEKAPANQGAAAAGAIAGPGGGGGEGEIRRHKHGVLLVLAALLATTLVAAYFAYSRRPARSGKAGIGSIAVLPFANKSDDPNAEYLSDGIPESLINSLSQLPGLKVIAVSPSSRYKGKEVDVQEAARALGVEAILTGRVLQRGDGLVIGVELVRASDKTQVWGEQYDRKMSDLLATQREIAREIVGELRLKVSGGEGGFAKHYTESNEAYQLYLKGRFQWNKRTEEGLRKAIGHFNQAIEQDPGFALAYAGLADCYVVPANRLPPREAMPKAKAAAERALELDETLAEAHASLARVLAAYDWDWAGAEQE